MRVYVIRHAKVNMNWPKRCNSRAFNRLCEKYDRSRIEDVNNKKMEIDAEKLYVSTLSRTKKTAEELFPGHQYEEDAALNEVPLSSSFNCRIKLPLWLWNATGRLQWLLNSKRQKETKRETVDRAEEICKKLISIDQDVILVSHGFFMRTLIKQLRRNGFEIHNNKTSYNNLQLVEATK